MKCHYEILNISRDAEEAEIKTAYKKLALKWHPDKNLDNLDEAKEQFQLVQQAYEILSDRQERAWYDNHREQILRGSNKDYEDNSLDVFQYFTTTCFKGYSDKENSFYSVYRNVFEQIAKEDMEYMEEKEEFCDIPVFGTSTSDYEAIVGPFYSYWLSYSTKKSYVWLDPYNINEIRERRAIKLIDKENKKVRAKAKKERNEEIRNLVAFVRKRDKRVQAQNMKIEAKAKEQKLKLEEMSKQKKLERRKEHESSKQTDWMKFDNVKSELEEIEKKLAEEFGEEFSNSEDDESYDEMDNLYCVACNKIFKTPKAFENHESSKRHKDNVEKLRDTMLEEDEDNLDSYGEGDIVEEDLLSNYESNVDICTDDELLEFEEEIQEVELPAPTKGKKKKKKSKLSNLDEGHAELSTEKSRSPEKETVQLNVSRKERRKSKGKSKATVIDEVKCEDVTETAEDPLQFNEDVNDNTDTKDVKKGKKSNKIKHKNEETDDDENDELEEIDNGTKTKKSNKKKTKKPVKAKLLDDIDLIDKDHCCVYCQDNFNSKNKLFEHLKKTGHSVHIPTKQENVKHKKKSIKDL